VVDCYAELTISVDGVGERHERLRHWPGGFAQLERHVRQLAAEKRAAERGPLLRVNVVLMRDNLPEFAHLCETVADWGIDEISYNQLGGRDRPEFFPDHRLRPEDIDTLEAMLASLRLRLAARGVRLLGQADYLQRFRASADNQRLPVHDCRPGESFLFVDERGLASPCHHTVDDVGLPVTALTTPADLPALTARFAAALQQRCPLACGDCHGTQVWAKFSR
jgi:MoaA/NifB/PqqE/SkfB family radical SAM enzyme